MKNDQITFDCVRSVLLDLGFVETVVPGPYLLFEHSSSKTLLPYRVYQTGESVSWADLVMTRRLLDERGILAAEQLNSRLDHATVPDR